MTRLALLLPLCLLLSAPMAQADSRRNLPPCTMDSFVYSAGGNAEHIYGDEGANGLPPIFGFTQSSRINTGITGVRDQGLTTGHGSYLPNAWGADEFLAPPGEWSLSGTNNGNSQYNNAAVGLDAADQAEAYQANGSGAGGNYPPPPGPPPAGQEWNPTPVLTHGEFDGYMTVQEATDFNSGDPQKTAAAWTSFAERTHGGLTTNDQYIIHSEILHDGSFNPTF